MSSMPDTMQTIADAEAALEAARANLKAAERAPALRERLSLVNAQRGGIIARSDPVWRDFDDATRLVAHASEAVEQAEADLTLAQRRHQAQLREQAVLAYGATDAGRSLLHEIGRLKRLYDDAAAKELGSVASYSHMLGVERGRFNEGVSKVLSTMQPAEPPAPSGPPPRFTLAALRACYLHDGIGRIMPSGVARFEYEDYGVLQQFREVLREELAEAYRVYRDLEGEKPMSAASVYDPATLPLRQAKERCGKLHTAVQEITMDLQILQRRANDSGQYL